MLFSSPIYIFLFLPIAVIIYFIFMKWRLVTTCKIWLIAASFYFYGYSAPQYLLLVLTSICINFFLGIELCRLCQIPAKSRSGDTLRKRKIVLGAGVTFNLCLLGYFKYADFFLTNVNLATGFHYTLLELSLPLAISFYTFQQIAFLVDCYYAKTAEQNFLNYCFYIMFFPQLIAGPIVRHRELIPQFVEMRNRFLNWSNIAMGIFVFAMGLFKKVVIADSFVMWANAGFDTANDLSFLEAWAVSLSYTFQLYFDFSGYSDMAIGAALLFNIRLPINFNSPYKALNIQDFWQRWHMTLSRWLRDYLYIPMGGNRKGKARTVINLIITFLLGGLWHGAGWTFIVWGAMHGTALALHRLWRQTGIRMPSIVGWFCTFFFINVAWVVFRAETLSDALRVLRGMFGSEIKIPFMVAQMLTYITPWNFSSLAAVNDPAIVSIYSVVYIVCFALLAFFAPNTMQLIEFVPYEGIYKFKTDAKTAFVLAVLLFVSFLTFTGNVSQSKFLYFNF
jgi:D-alanyl-lipoteichoic acid acyltransferase DltB (MBOAT superfamily)